MFLLKKIILENYDGSKNLFYKFEDRLHRNEIAGIDGHGHIFNTDCVPGDYFEVKGLKDVVSKPGISNFLIAFLKGLWPTHDDPPELIANYMEEGTHTQEQILEHWRNLYLFYQRETGKKMAVCPLTMDFEEAFTGKTITSYKAQLAEVGRLANLKELIGLVLPFAFIDSRRTDLVEILDYAFNELGFVGAKGYPSLWGMLPSQEGLMKVWQRFAELGLPVLSHCGDGGVHTNAKKILVEGFIEVNKKEQYISKELKFSSMPWDRNWMQFFNNPKHWGPVLNRLKDYGKIIDENGTQHMGFKLCLAHLGGWDSVKEYIKGKKNTWFGTILEYARTYPGFYFDVSFESIFPETIKFVCDEILAKDPVVAKKVIFGLDNYMSKIKKKSDKMVVDALTGYRPYLEQISLENTTEFLRPY